MRYARTYKDLQLGITSSTPSSDPYGSRRDPGNPPVDFDRRILPKLEPKEERP